MTHRSPAAAPGEFFSKEGLTAPFCKIDFRVGGIFHNCMRSPEGMDYWSPGVYREIILLERIVYIDSFADEKGNGVPATPECLTLT